jgi:hypothetical protein
MSEEKELYLCTKAKKVEYTNKKEAQAKLNFLRQTLSKKKLPVRIYNDRDKWYMTHKVDREILPSELLELAMKYAERFGTDKDRLMINKIRKITSNTPDK